MLWMRADKLLLDEGKAQFINEIMMACGITSTFQDCSDLSYVGT